MVFADKLVILMEITSTSNKQLADAIRVDPSLISRFRSGRRRVPENSEHIGAMAHYFAARCKAKYQLEFLSEVTGMISLSCSTNVEKVAAIITSWLLTEESIPQSQANLFLHAFDQLKYCELENPATETTMPKSLLKERELYAFYGDDGRRRATILFEQIVLASSSAVEIKILTEGNMEWIWKDKQYAKEISDNIKKGLSRGNTITRIVPRITNLAMAFDTVTRWLPLYFTGSVKSYYYPNIRDNVFCRTLYVAPGIAALSATAVGEQAECGATFISTDPTAVAYFDREYMDYLARCRLATNIYNDQSSPLKLRRCVRRFCNHQSNCITILSCLSFVSTPPEIISELAKDFDVKMLNQDYSFCFAHFEQIVVHHRYTEVFPLESLEDIIAGKARYVALEISQNKAGYYTPDEYCRHLINVVNMLCNYPNYHVVLSKGNDLESNVYVKESCQVMLLRTTPPITICETEYTDMISSVWEYALSKTQTGLTDMANKIESISRLKQLISQLCDYTNCHYDILK